MNGLHKDKNLKASRHFKFKSSSTGDCLNISNAFNVASSKKSFYYVYSNGNINRGSNILLLFY